MLSLRHLPDMCVEIEMPPGCVCCSKFCVPGIGAEALERNQWGGEEWVEPSPGLSAPRRMWFRKEDVPVGMKIVVDTRRVMTEKSWV